MADVERSVISKVLYSGGLPEVFRAGVTAAFFHDEENGRTWDWMVEFWNRYGKEPTRDALRMEWPQYKLIKVPEPLDYYIDQLLKYHTRYETVELVADAAAALKDEDIDYALTAMSDGVTRIARSRAHTEGVSICAADVEVKALEWLWPGWLPKGKLVVMEGDPGSGKSMLTMDIAARVSADLRWPNGSRPEPGGVIVLNAEDAPEDTIVPRLMAAGGDRHKVHFLPEVPGPDGPEPFTLVRLHLQVLRDLVLRTEARLVIIDPLAAYLPAGTNSHADADIRRILRPLSALAEETGATVLVVRHLNKSTGTQAQYRGGGSIGIGAAARAQFVVANNPDDDETDPDRRRVMANQKFNLGPDPDALSYRISRREGDLAAHLEWDPDPVFLTATELLQPRKDRQGATEAAKEWLLDELADQEGHSPADLKSAAKAAGHSPKAIERAKQQLGDMVTSSGSGRYSTWWLDTEDDDDDIPSRITRIHPGTGKSTSL